MELNKKKTTGIISLVILCCIAMAIIETVVEPAYAIKSVMKIIIFIAVPVAYMKIEKISFFNSGFALDKKTVLQLLGLGAAIYGIIMVAYLITKGIFDYAALSESLAADQNASKESFIWIASYISFGNSLLEEFMFRLFGFLVLSKYTSKKVAYIFSSSMFAVYHVAMFAGAFPLPLVILALIGLVAGGLIFDYVDDRSETIYNSWIIHMFADFAIMTIWYLHI